MGFGAYVLKCKWLLIMSFFIGCLLLGLKLFMPSDKQVYPFFKTKVEFKMDPSRIKKVILDNGMNILVFKNDAMPKVLMQIAYDIGSWVENSGEKGLAHLIEHMIFKGTQKLSEGDIDAIARKYGATYNAFTSKDMTSYYFEVNKNNWQPFLGILADCMQNACFDEQHLASEFRAVIQELRMYKDRYWNVMLERANEIIYPSNHPYHFPIIGFKQDLVNLSAQDIKKFYKKYYSPDRATLFIVGDIDIGQAIKVAKQNFENIKSDAEKKLTYGQVKKERFPHISKSTATNNTKLYEEVKKEQLGFYWLIPGLKEKNETLVSMVEFILGQGEGSRLYKRLVDDKKVAVAVTVMSDHLIESGVFLILLEPVDGKSEECAKLIREELNKLIVQGVIPAELNKVKRTRGREFFQSLQSLSSFTYEWIKSYLVTKDESDVFKKIEKFDKIDSGQIQNFVKVYLDPFFMNTIELLPLPEDKKLIWQQLKEESEKLDMQILSKHLRTTPIEEPKFVKTLSDPSKLDFSFSKPEYEFVLDNGLTVLLKRNGQWPALGVNCQFRQATFFAASKEGILVDLMMNLLMEGSAQYSKKENVDFFESSGSSYSFDSTGGSLCLLNKDYDIILKRFFTVLTTPKFEKDAVEKLQDIFIDSYQRRKDSATEVTSLLLKNIVYKNHPYEWTFDEAIDLIKSSQVKDFDELHKKYLTPQNMILIVVGDFDIKKMEKTIKDIFDNWSGEKHHEIVYPKGEFIPNQKIDEFMLRDQVVLALGQPSIINVYHPDLVPIKILNFICFDSLGSRLFKVREQTGLFYTAFGMFAAGAAKEHGFDYLGAILSLDKVDEAEKLLVNVINEVGADGVNQKELDDVKQLYLKALIDLTSSNESIAAMLGRLKAFELGFDYYDKVLKQVQTIKLDELNKIARKYFVANKMARVRVGRVGQNI